MTALDEPLELMGAQGSPYTRKLLALLRYRRIPHAILWASYPAPPEGYPAPKVALLPTVYFRGEDGAREAAVDTTPIIRRLEAMRGARSVIPNDPALAFLNDLIEDYADEWVTKAMFHYRWAFERDAENAGPLLVYWLMPTAPEAEATAMAQRFSRRQIDRLYVVGSNETTAETIEASYRRLVDILDALVQRKGHVLGARPSSADFALYGQLLQLGTVEPTSAEVMAARSPRLRAWLDRVEDLSGLKPSDDDWFAADEAGDALAPLLAEIGRVYAPFLLANAAAAASGAERFDTEIDGRAWTQPTFHYQAKCLAALRARYAGLEDAARRTVDGLIAGSGCEALFG